MPYSMSKKQAEIEALTKDNLNFLRIEDDELSVGDENQKMTSKSIEFVPSLLSAPKPRIIGPKSISKSAPAHMGPKAVIDDGKYHIQKPEVLLIDIWNIIAPFSFSQTLEAFIDDNLPTFVTDNFENQFLRNVIDSLITDNETRRICNPLLPPITKTGSSAEQITSLLDNIQYRRKHEPETVCIFEEIIDRIVLQGFDANEIKPAIFDDARPRFGAWSSAPVSIRMYTLDNSTETYQRYFLKAANFAPAIFNGHFNSKAEYKARDFSSLVNEIGVSNKSVFYMTSSFNRAGEAAKAGISSILVLRDHAEQKYSDAQLKKFFIIKNLKEVDFVSHIQ